MLYGGTVEELRAFLRDNHELAFDVESNGLNPRRNFVIGFSVATEHAGFYIATHSFNAVRRELEPTGFNWLATEVLNALQSKKLLTWNAAFDVPITKSSFGIDLRLNLHIDGQLLLHTIDENRFQYGLKIVAKEVFGDSAADAQADMLASIKANGGTKSDYYMADTALMAKYGIQDGILTAKLIKFFWPILQREGLESFFMHDEVMPLYKHVTLPMEERGIRIDRPYIEQAQSEIAADLTALEQQILKAIEPHLGPWKQWLLNKDFPPAREGPFAQAYCQLNKIGLPRTKRGAYSLTGKAINLLPDGHHKAVLLKQEYMTEQEIADCQELMWQESGSPGFNLQSPHHMKKLVFDTLKEQPLSRTPTGQPQIDDDMLTELGKKYEWAKDLQLFRSLTKLKGTYIDRFLEESEGDRFYARYKQFGTVTGRFSGDFQQLPRPLEQAPEGQPQIPELLIKHTNRIRNFFIADADGVLIDADYESLEPHVFSHVSNDPAIKEIFIKGWDFYSTVGIKTEKLVGFSPDKKAANYLGKLDKPKRQNVKPYALGIAYGEEDYKLHIELGVPQEEAKKLVKGYWEGFPVLFATSEANKKLILTHGFIAAEHGRRRRLYEEKEIADKHGISILDSLELWKRYHDNPKIYDWMKKQRKRLKRALNAAINFPTQSLASGIVNRASIATNLAFEAAGLPAIVIGQIHDELLVSCKKGYEQQAAKILQNCMENTYKISVPLKAEPVIGTRYGEIK